VSQRATTRSRRLVYPLDDRLAGEIAERLVALLTWDRASEESAVLRELMPELREDADRPVVAAALDGAALGRATVRGADLAYLVSLPRRPLDDCAAWGDLVARAPWVTLGVSALIAEAGPTLITGPRAPAMTVDWDNTLRVITRTSPVRDPR
jgi:hypothetical protein